MKDMMNPLVRFSPYGGQLIKEEIAGANNGYQQAENSVSTAAGIDRDMYAYVPAGGCPDAKQCQVFMVLRNDASQESAQKAMDDLKLKELAEERHFVLLFPNPLPSGWNYKNQKELDDDEAFLVRCFAALPKSKGTVAGFNGMIFYLAASAEASAMLTSLACHRPMDAAAIMIGRYPADYAVPDDGCGQPENAWVYEDNEAADAWLKKVNTKAQETNQAIKYFANDHTLSAAEVSDAWEKLFSETRRWRNDTYGTYQRRTNFTERGFTAHVKDTSLGDNHSFAHTWFEYVPEKLRGTSEKVPLLLNFHGGGCIGLYSAEQSGWHDIAERENFIVVYPDASIEKRWNAWNSPSVPSDFEFILKLIDHMKQVHPIDETRIYLSGFSMGSMMSNAMAAVYPDLFAGAVPCNAPNDGVLGSMEKMMARFKGNTEGFTEEQLNAVSPAFAMQKEKKSHYDYRIPVVQCLGLLDSGMPASADDRIWLQTFDFWKQYNNIPVTPYIFTQKYETGIAADSNIYECDDQRFLHQTWYTDDDSHLPLYQVLAAKRMPHALDLREIELGWNEIKHYARMSDGSLKYTK